MTSPADRRKALEILDAAVAAGARTPKVAELLGVGPTTLQRWRRQLAGVGDGVDGRKGSYRHVAHRLSEDERQRILRTCNEPQYSSLPPGQIVPDLADQGRYIGSERSFYRILHANANANANANAHGQAQRRSPGQVWPIGKLLYGLVQFLGSTFGSQGAVAISAHDTVSAAARRDLLGQASNRPWGFVVWYYFKKI